MILKIHLGLTCMLKLLVFSNIVYFNSCCIPIAWQIFGGSWKKQKPKKEQKEPSGSRPTSQVKTMQNLYHTASKA